MTSKLSEQVGDKKPAVEAADRQSAQPFNQFRHRPRSIILLTIAGLAVIVALSCVAFQFYSNNNAHSHMVHANGRIEALETHIIAATATRVKSVNVKEGDFVHKGQLIVVLDSENLEKRIGQSRAALRAALHATRESDAQVAVVQREVSKAKAKSKGFFAKIFSTKAGRQKKEMQLRQQMLQAKMMSFQAHSAVASVRGAQEQASSKLSYFNMTSPTNGICTIRSVQPGELVGAGQVMLTIVDPQSAYLRGFIPESDVGRIKIGLPAQVFLDSSTKPMSGKVTLIDDHPSFTPENVYFKKDRVRQAYGIKISIDHPAGLAKPGMPAEANIILNSQKNN